jgi:hypothetical protein
MEEKRGFSSSAAPYALVILLLCNASATSVAAISNSKAMYDKNSGTTWY